MDIVGKRRIFLSISGVATIIGLISIVIFGFKLAIDFTGGSVTQIVSTNNKTIDVTKIKDAFTKNKIQVVTIRKNSEKEITIRTVTITDSRKNKVLATANSNNA